MKRIGLVSMIAFYVFTSGFLESGPAGRVTIADLVLLLIIFLASIPILSRNYFYFPSSYLYATPMLLVFLTSSIFSVYPERAVFELVVLLFSFFGGISIVNLLLPMPEKSLRLFFKLYICAIGAVSLLCLIDFFAWPGLISSRRFGGLQGSFRNTGQAGSFFGVHFALILAILLSKLAPLKPIYLLSALFTFVSLVFTLKRASLIAVVAGILFLAVVMALSSSATDKKKGVLLIVATIIFGAMGYILFFWALGEIPGLRWRFEYKFSADTIEAFEGGFFAENVKSALHAFSDRPLLGVGLDNVRDVYQSHEIHSTYLGIIAYGGIFGTIFYAFFMVQIFRLLAGAAKYRMQTPWAAFLYYLFPLLCGQMIGWGYTYHIRKREFWILVILVVIANEMVCQLKRRASTSFIEGRKFSDRQLTEVKQ